MSTNEDGILEIHGKGKTLDVLRPFIDANESNQNQAYGDGWIDGHRYGFTIGMIAGMIAGIILGYFFL